jgi:tyrosyl-tRNA synthetase
MEMDEIKELCKNDIREAKKRLAFEVTKLVHGIEEANNAKITAEELFSGNGISSDMPNITLNKNKLGINILDLLVETNLTNSKSEARRLIEQKGISINQEKVESLDKTIEEKDLNNNFIIIQKGKKVFLKIIFDKNA